MTATSEEEFEIPVPIHANPPEVMGWLRSSGVDPVVAAPSLTPVFSEQSFEPGDEELRELWAEGVPVSWLGGPAIGAPAIHPEKWPTTASGQQLAHVASIALPDVQGIVDADGRTAWASTRASEQPSHALALLPTTGSLEVFHDLTSHGSDASDGEQGAWLVQWVAEPAGLPLVDGGDPPEPACQQVLAMPGFTIRCPEDVASGPEVDHDAYLDAYEDWQLSWQVQRFWRREEHPIPSSHLAGHPSHGRGVAEEILREVLPLDADDEYLLVFDIESWTTLSGWFGDAGSLEVWMRASDLRARAFEKAWCLVRTD
ncbi:DUF1963 domain-containing protein [Luteococcus sp. Sow4_B9]|uniref:DUF1963 domain-containing protein n=1 Tax=Luteococcus sp. Sow4_B9 TaxID=3438792 RepID=UPI003F975F82